MNKQRLVKLMVAAAVGGLIWGGSNDAWAKKGQKVKREIRGRITALSADSVTVNSTPVVLTVRTRYQDFQEQPTDLEAFAVGEESLDLAWRPVADLVTDEALDASIRRMARRWLARVAGR